MTQKEHIDYWVSSAKHDYDTMMSLYENEKYDWALFLGHLVIEKLLKALFVKNNENSIPPKLHNLVRLAEIAKLNIDEEKMIILDTINDFNIEVRYPQYKNEFYKLCDKNFADINISEIKEQVKWLESLLK